MSKRAPKHFFSKNASVNLPRTSFDMSFVNTTTLTTDYLYPVFCQFVIPGDTWNVSVSNFIRMISPIDVPMMDNLYADYHFWFVPWRLVWDKTKYFFGEQDRTPNVDEDYTIPQVKFDSSVSNSSYVDGSVPFAGLPQVGSLYDYYGLPIQGTDNLLSGTFSVNAIPFRSYNLIYDEWYRDEQRCELSYYNVGDTEDTADKYFLKKRGKRFDFFTSSLLEPQIGDPVSLPLGTLAPVVTSNSQVPVQSSSVQVRSISTGALPPKFETLSNWYTQPQGVLHGLNFTSSSASNDTGGVYISNMWTDMSEVTNSTVALLRQAFQMQAYQEIQARGGTRMTEYIYNQYGVIQPDILTRPEFLGGMHQELSVQPIVQNSSTDSTSPQGNLTGIIYGGSSTHGFTRSFTEHGYIIGIMNIYSDLTYFQGLDKHWSIQTPLDIPLPIFANLTDEAVYKKQIVLTGTESDDEVWGYCERYAPYKYSKNTLTGLVRPNAPQTIGQWSLAELFVEVPENNEEFIEMNTPISRIEAVNSSSGKNNPHAFIVNQKFSGNVVRVLPAYSDPMKWFMRV